MKYGKWFKLIQVYIIYDYSRSYIIQIHTVCIQYFFLSHPECPQVSEGTCWSTTVSFQSARNNNAGRELCGLDFSFPNGKAEGTECQEIDMMMNTCFKKNYKTVVFTCSVQGFTLAQNAEIKLNSC